MPLGGSSGPSSPEEILPLRLSKGRLFKEKFTGSGELLSQILAAQTLESAFRELDIDPRSDVGLRFLHAVGLMIQDEILASTSS